MTLKKGLTLFITAAVTSFVFGREVLFVNESPKEIVPVIVIQAKAVQPKLSKRELTCMADMAYHEARGEGVKGIAAVIHVTLNRKDSGKFPSDICGVVYQKIKGKCQYAWVCEKPKKRSYAYRTTKQYKEIELLAATVSSVPDRSAIDPTRGSLYYKRTDVPSKFFRERLIPQMAIGSHRFYVEA